MSLPQATPTTVPRQPPARASLPFRLPAAVRPLACRLRGMALARGVPFLVAWGHRAAGAALAVYVVAHILTLSALREPERFARLMQTYRSWPFVLAEWALALPVIFHALNGGRLILFESFRFRRDDDAASDGRSRRSALYVASLPIAMLLGDQAVSAGVFWLYTALAAALVTAVYCRRPDPRTPDPASGGNCSGRPGPGCCSWSRRTCCSCT